MHPFRHAQLGCPVTRLTLQFALKPQHVLLQFLGVSIWTYKDRSVAQIVTQVVSHPAEEAASWGAVWLPILMMYSPVQIVCTVFSLSFMLAPPSFAAAFWVGFMALYYAITLPGAPEHTGRFHPLLCTAGLPFDYVGLKHTVLFM